MELGTIPSFYLVAVSFNRLFSTAMRDAKLYNDTYTDMTLFKEDFLVAYICCIVIE
jgi:hypothetical protein